MAKGNYPDTNGDNRNDERKKQIQAQKEKAAKAKKPPVESDDTDAETTDDNEDNAGSEDVPFVKTPAKRGRKPSGKEREQFSILIDKDIAELIRLNVPTRFASINAYINSVVEADVEANRAKYEKTAELQRQLYELQNEE